MSILRHVSPTAMTAFMASSLGVPPVAMGTVLSIFKPKDGADASPGSLIGSAKGMLHAIARMNDDVATRMIVGFIRGHERAQELEQVVSALSHLPFKHFEGEHDGLEDFVRRGLLPLARDLTEPPAQCPCCTNQDPQQFVEEAGFRFCLVCDHFQEVTP